MLMLNNLVGFGVNKGKSFISSLDWRLYVTDNHGGTLLQIDRVEYYPEPNAQGTELTGSTSPASASGSFNQYTPDNAFNNDTQSTNGQKVWIVDWSGGPEWLAYDFAADGYTEPVVIRSMKYWARDNNDSNSDRQPKDMDVQYYDGASWVTLKSFIGLPFKPTWPVTLEIQ